MLAALLLACALAHQTAAADESVALPTPRQRTAELDAGRGAWRAQDADAAEAAVPVRTSGKLPLADSADHDTHGVVVGLAVAGVIIGLVLAFFVGYYVGSVTKYAAAQRTRAMASRSAPATAPARTNSGAAAQSVSISLGEPAVRAHRGTSAALAAASHYSAPRRGASPMRSSRLDSMRVTGTRR